jgi:hypothetical protein
VPIVPVLDYATVEAAQMWICLDFDDLA